METHSICPSCHKAIESDVEICPNCGQEFCPDCDHPLEPNAVVCRGCGLEFGLYCFNCDGEVESQATACPHCGADLESEQVSAESEESIDTEREATDGRIPDRGGALVDCPNCQASDSVTDGFCTNCGQAFCSQCSQAVGEEEESCPKCGAALYFDCPSCQFELTAGTQICPNCGVLFPPRCEGCGAGLTPGESQCPVCRKPISFSRPTSARIIHTLTVKDQLIRIVACDKCGSQFDIAGGVCRECGHRVCPNCLTNLENEELRCPRCGLETAGSEAVREAIGTCSTCGKPISEGSDECPHCNQLLCPACGTAIQEDDPACPSCGVEFELVCPRCEVSVSLEAAVCPECGLPF